MESETKISGKISEYNEADLKMIRIHECQRIINRLRTCPIAYNNDFGLYNFEIIISELNSLYSEVKPKTTDTERKVGDKYRKDIMILLEYLPLKKQFEGSFNGVKGIKLLVDIKYWKVLRNKIVEYEDFVREMLELHGLSSFNKEQKEDWD